MADQIFSLLPGATEILFAIGAGDKVAAVSHACNYPSPALQLPKATKSSIDAAGTVADINASVRLEQQKGHALYTLDEALLAELQPDLLITQDECEVCAIDLATVRRSVEKCGLTGCEILALNPQSVTDLFKEIRRIAFEADEIGGGERLCNELTERLSVVSDKIIFSPKVKFVCAEWPEPLMLAANWFNDVASRAGGNHSLTVGGEPSVVHKWEEVTAFGPEVLIVSPCGLDVDRAAAEIATLQTHHGWDSLPAVQKKRVFAVDGDALFHRCGPRLVDSVELLYALLHEDTIPKAFADLCRRV
jgi:iron complex transport system substrate-binding protein